MLSIIKTRLKQGCRTIKFPDRGFPLPKNYLGKPVIKKCSKCKKCQTICPVSCISESNNGISIDIGKCIFCRKCFQVCEEGAIQFEKTYELAEFSRSNLIYSTEMKKQESLLNKEIKRVFGRSLKLRQVSAGGCNACEADCNVLETVGWDMGRFGIQFVASPRHADAILITGPITKNMELALKKTYDALASPKLVITVGACAISGGIFAESSEVLCGVKKFYNVDLYIPGCPPHPATILHGLLKLIGKISE